MENTNSKGHMGSFLILTIVVALIAGGGSYFWGLSVGRTQSSTQSNILVPNIPKAEDKSIVVNQSATAVGKVVKVEDNSVTIQSDGGKILGFKMASHFNIYNPTVASSSGVAKTSQNLKDVVLNQKYILSLVLQDGTYVVTTMNKVQQ